MRLRYLPQGLLLLVLLLMVGCLAGLEGSENLGAGNTTVLATGESENSTPANKTSPGEGRDQGRTNSTAGEPNGTTGVSTREPLDPGWPPLEEAVVRPGVRLQGGGGTCTSNFIFQVPENRSLYLGTAAHCVDGVPVGGHLSIAGQEASGTLAYSGWAVDSTQEEAEGHDFALVKINASDRDLVHPAVLHWGGPTGMEDTPTVGDSVVIYGNSTVSARAFVEELRPGRGVITDAGQRTFDAAAALPGYHGDSGAPAMSAEAQALGVLTRVEPTVFGPLNRYVLLGPALDEARNHGLDVTVATWPPLEQDPLGP